MSTVQQVAKELGLTSQEVIARLKAMGQPADSHLTPVEDSVAQRLRRDSAPPGDPADNGGRAAAGFAAPPATGAATGPDGEKQTRGLGTESEEPAPSSEPPRDEPPGDEPPGKGPSDRGAPGKKPKQSSVLKQVAELPVLIVLAFAIAVVIKIFLVQAFFIPSASMNPTLVRGDRVLVEKVGYRLGEPRRGQVIVFAQETVEEAPDLPWQDDVRNFFRELLGLPTGDETDFIKRVVAVGGDVISYQGNDRRLVVNGERVDEPYIRGGRDNGSTKITPANCKGMQLDVRDDGCRVPAGTVFVMGDNRSNSLDSRVFGPVDNDEIVGRAWLIIWPPEDFGTL
ncbi:MAG: signal peptidase I [Actinomycetota bacterium]